MAEGVFTATQLKNAYLAFEDDYNEAKKYVEGIVIGKIHRQWSWKNFKYIETTYESLEDYQDRSFFSTITIDFPNESLYNIWAWEKPRLRQLRALVYMAEATADQKLVLTDSEYARFRDYL